jgi:hypothetical protein
VILLAMLFLCNKPTEGPSRVASHFLELIFIILAVVSLTLEIYVGKEEKQFSISKKMRFISLLLGVSSMLLFVKTLINATCMNNDNNEDIISNDVWALLRPVFFAASVGMYAQFFTLFMHIFMQKTNFGQSHCQNVEPHQNSYQGAEMADVERENDQNSCKTDEQFRLMSQTHQQRRHGSVSEGDGESQQTTASDLKAMIKFVLDTLGYIYIIVTVTISILSLNKGASLLKVVVWTQVVTHVFIVVLAWFVVVRCIRPFGIYHVCLTTSCACNSCSPSLWDRICKFWSWIFLDPERSVFIAFFLMGGVGYNMFGCIAYIKGNNCLIDDIETQVGVIETGFGLFSAIMVFSVIFYLKLYTEKKRDNPNIHSKGYRFCLTWLQFLSISLAVIDVLKEHLDTDKETIVECYNNLLIFYDVLRPTIVDFRIHAAIMMICIVHEARAEGDVQQQQQQQQLIPEVYTEIDE